MYFVMNFQHHNDRMYIHYIGQTMTHIICSSWKTKVRISKIWMKNLSVHVVDHEADDQGCETVLRIVGIAHFVKHKVVLQ